MSASQGTAPKGAGGGHTKGPWWLSSSTIVCTPKAQIIANCAPTGIPALDLPSAEVLANARLIAAAPELLEALEYAIQQVPELATVPGIVAALAKAGGES